MIGRAHRFHGHGSLRNVYGRGQVVRGQFFALKYISNPKRKTFRVAVVVSKKVHKSAVIRNKIRRRIFGAIQEFIDPQAPPLDLVFVVYSENVASLPAPEIQQLVASQLERVGAIKPAENNHAIVERKES